MIITSFRSTFIWATLRLWVCFLFAASLTAQDHPRLLISLDELPAIRDRLDREPYASMLAELIAFAENDETLNDSYKESTAAMNCGFLYLMTGEEVWAEKARAYAESRFADTSSSNGWDRNIKGLALYWHGRAIALAYDFCYNSTSWQAPSDPNNSGSEPFVDLAWRELKDQADRIFEDGGTQQNRNTASNWQNNRFATSGLIYLAIEEHLTESEKERIVQSKEKVENYLVANMSVSPDSRGFNLEAIGYQMYPLSFTGPFGIAAERADYGFIGDAAPAAMAYAMWNVYGMAARIPHIWEGHFGSHLDFGDDNNIHRGEGCYGLAFYFCPEFLHPGMRYWYDRMVGSLGDQTFDRERGGTIYSLLYYRDDIQEENPMNIKEWTNAFIETGGNGYFTFRDGYVDGDDMMAQIYAKFRGNAGHNGPDALSFRILGLDAPFAVGGGRYGRKTAAVDTGVKQHVYYRSMNTLYPTDPENELTISGESGKLVGIPQSFPDGGGSVVLQIDKNNVNTRNHTRRFLADYSELSGASGVYVISDTSNDGVFWQFCQVDLDESVQAIQTNGNTFTVTNPNGSSLKGTVLYPEGELNWVTGTRSRGSSYGYKGVRYETNEFVHFQGAEGDFLVVFTVVDDGETHPLVESTTGSGANTNRVVQIGGLTVSVDGDAISRTAEIQSPPTVEISNPTPDFELLSSTGELSVSGLVTTGSADLLALEVYFGDVSEYLGDGSLDVGSGAFSFNIPEIPTGEHLFRVKAVDVNGLSSYSDYLPFSVRLSFPPVVEILSSGDGSILSIGDSEVLNISAADPDEGGGIDSVVVMMNGAEEELIGTGPWAVDLDTSSAGLVTVQVVATDLSGESTSSLSRFMVNRGDLSEPWINFDIGSSSIEGRVTLSGTRHSMFAAGADIWGQADAFHFAFQQHQGDGSVTTTVLNQENTNQWAKAGPMIRASAEEDAAYVALLVTPSNGLNFQYRLASGESTSSENVTGVAAPVSLRLVRSENKFTGYYQPNGTDEWVMIGQIELELPEVAFAGVSGASNNSSKLMRVVMDNTTIKAKPVSTQLEIVPSGSGSMKAVFGSVSGFSYQLQSSADGLIWTDFDSELEGTGDMLEVDLTSVESSQFIRVLTH